MGLKLITPPAVEPVSVSELRKQLELAASDTAHDAHLTRLIVSARRVVERETRQALITQTWLVVHSCFPPTGHNIWLPRPPLQTVSWVKYYDGDGTLQTWGTSHYVAITSSRPGRIDKRPASVWPTLEASREDAVQIQYLSGYGTAASAVPEELRQAVLALASYWFEVRTTVEVPEHLLSFLRSQRSGVGPEFFGLTR